jgi:hypothetical protein
MADQFLSTEQLSLLWQAFSIKGCDDDTEKKAGIAKVFKSCMDDAQIWVQQGNGDLVAKPDPRGGRQFSNKTHRVEFDKAQAGYLGECLAELKGAKNQDGTPRIDASVADDVHHLETVVLPNWKATVPGGLSLNEADKLPAPADATALPAPDTPAVPVEEPKE